MRLPPMPVNEVQILSHQNSGIHARGGEDHLIGGTTEVLVLDCIDVVTVGLEQTDQT